MRRSERLPERRLSDRDRRSAEHELRRAHDAGYLSDDTLERRLDAVCSARRRTDVATLLGDLPAAGLLGRVRTWLHDVGRPAPVADAPARRLTPPPVDRPGPFVIGRAPTCDLWIDDRSVSSHHADLRRRGDGWTLVDVGSSNGTRVNGWLVTEAELRPGDYVTFGAVGFVFDD